MTKRVLFLVGCLVVASRAFAQAPTTVALSQPSSSTAVAGSTISITDTVWNSGTSSSSGGTQTFSLVPSGGGAAVTLSPTRIVPGLSPGAISTGTTTVTIPANTAPGTYMIGAGSLRSTGTITITANSSTFPLTVSVVGPPGNSMVNITTGSANTFVGNCPPTCSPAIPSGISVKLQPVVNGTYLQGWSSSSIFCQQGTGPCTFTMDGAKSIAATFGVLALVPFKVYVNGPGNVNIMVQGQSLQPCNLYNGCTVGSVWTGSTVMLAATTVTVPASGGPFGTPQHTSVFVNWTGCSGMAQPPNGLLVAVNSSNAINCTANFR